MRDLLYIVLFVVDFVVFNWLAI